VGEKLKVPGGGTATNVLLSHRGRKKQWTTRKNPSCKREPEKGGEKKRRRKLRDRDSDKKKRSLARNLNGLIPQTKKPRV